MGDAQLIGTAVGRSLVAEGNQMDRSEARWVEHVVDTGRYPLSEPGSPTWRDAVLRARYDLHRFGCSVMPDFIRRPLRETLREEGTEVAPSAYYDVEIVNAYNLPVDTSWPDDHPGRILMQRGNAFVARDKIPRELIIHRLYTSQLFQRFLAACLGLPAIHPLADPLAGLCLNVVPPGREHPWHFDLNELSVSILTQAADEGGAFEYCPSIRSARNENLDDVRDVLSGRRQDLVRRLAVRPGDLQLFMGRFSLHRVSTVEGSHARHSAIFAYSHQPGVVGDVNRTKQLFGRTETEHLAAEPHEAPHDYRTRSGQLVG
jgi:hypothetical protein